MRTSPTMQMQQYVRNYSMGRSELDRPRTPNIRTEFIDRPHVGLVKDPVEKLARAEWAFHQQQVDDGVEVIKRGGRIDNARDLSSRLVAQKEYGIEDKEESAFDYMHCTSRERAKQDEDRTTLCGPVLRSTIICPPHNDEKEEEERISSYRERQRESIREIHEISKSIEEARAAWEKTQRNGTLWYKERKGDPSEYLVGDSDYKTHTHVGKTRTGDTFFSVRDDEDRTKHFTFDNKNDDDKDSVEAYWDRIKNPRVKVRD